MTVFFMNNAKGFTYENKITNFIFNTYHILYVRFIQFYKCWYA